MGKQPSGEHMCASTFCLSFSSFSRDSNRSVVGIAIRSILLTSFTSQRFHAMRSKCSSHGITSQLSTHHLVGNLNNSTISTFLGWLASNVRRRLIFCNLHKLTFNSSRMCFYHVLKYIFSSSLTLE